jgi:hypothetical protein
MSLQTEIIHLLEAGPADNTEYLPILPPSLTIAKYIAAFANCGGGWLILGVAAGTGRLKIAGIAPDFNVVPITQKALLQLSCDPAVEYGYVSYDGKQVFAIKVNGSLEKVLIDDKEYRFVAHRLVQIDPDSFRLGDDANDKIRTLSTSIVAYRQDSTRSGSALFEHYLGLLKIIDNLRSILFPLGLSVSTMIPEGKIMSRILYSSAVDNFEVFLGDLLYEISLAKPEIIRSNQTVTVEEVLRCADIEEFVKFVAKRKISRLQKGSVKEFIKENPPIADLGVFSVAVQADIEKIIQIRHLYTHSNGIVDERFLLHYPQGLSVGVEFQLTIQEMLEKIEYMVDIAMRLNRAAIRKHGIA